MTNDETNFLIAGQLGGNTCLSERSHYRDISRNKSLTDFALEKLAICSLRSPQRDWCDLMEVWLHGTLFDIWCGQNRCTPLTTFHRLIAILKNNDNQCVSVIRFCSSTQLMFTVMIQIWPSTFSKHDPAGWVAITAQMFLQVTNNKCVLHCQSSTDQNQTLYIKRLWIKLLQSNRLTTHTN